MSLNHEQSEAIYKNILDIVLIGLDAREIEAWQASEIAEYVLGKVEKFESEHEVNVFYEELSSQWPFLELLLQSQKNEDIKKVGEEVSESALTLLKHGKVDDALSLVKSVTN